MVTYYITAMAAAKGAEGDLQKYRKNAAATHAWNSPLPPIIPIHAFDESFPRDRVDPVSLKKLPPLNLEGPALENKNIVLSLKEAEIFRNPQSYLREIHGKQIPKVSNTLFIDWKGLLLNPADLRFPETSPPAEVASVIFHFKSWQMGLYKIRFDETRLWWENCRYSCLWQVRKSRP